MASGHGENIIDAQICGGALKKLKKYGYIPDVGKLMKRNIIGKDWWDLGLLTIEVDF